jgi:phosphoglycolate phosphatase-like HAD superfamily hydrolase
MRHVGFDADGVLLNSEPVSWRAAEQVLARHGRRIAISSREEMEQAFGRAAQEALVGASHVGDLRMAHRLLMRQMASDITLFNTAIDAARQVAARKMLVTAALADGVTACLCEHAGLFDEIYGFEHGRKPDLLARLAPRLGVYVTDTAVDIADCRALAIPVVGCLWGYDGRHLIEAAEPDAIAETPVDLPMLITQFDKEDYR